MTKFVDFLVSIGLLRDRQHTLEIALIPKMNVTCVCMVPCFLKAADSPFDLISVFLQLPSSDVEKLCVLVAYYGGRMQRRLDPTITHLVTMEMTGVRGIIFKDQS